MSYLKNNINYIGPCVLLIEFTNMEEDRWIKEPDKRDKTNHSKFIVVVVFIGVALAAMISWRTKGRDIDP